MPKQKIVRAQPERLDIETARQLMAYLEENYPQWCLFFALTLFLGIRPDMAHGEIAKLAKAIERDGVEKTAGGGPCSLEKVSPPDAFLA